jgi:NADPH-dependent 2,4-dienoyl-CoA reductase/sulfur reductase-like enzyme
LATGGIPRQLQNTPGTDLNGVFLLRTMADADAIIAAAGKAKTAVVIGASFIGMEAAASLGARELGVTVVGIEDIPFAIVLGREIGQMFRAEHEANGIQFRLSSGVKQIVGKDGHASGVELKSGEILPTDFVVIGVGVRPATDFLTDSGLRLDDWDHSVHVNATLQTSDPNIYAAGDIARYEDGTGSDRGTRIEHWRAAEQQGIVAARNMLGGNEHMSKHIPFFWTTQWGLTLNYVGHAEKWDEIIYRGIPASKDFIAFFVAGGKLLAAAGCSHDAELDAIEFILSNNRSLSIAQMRDPGFNLIEFMHAS